MVTIIMLLGRSGYCKVVKRIPTKDNKFRVKFINNENELDMAILEAFKNEFENEQRKV